jgi:hypothetical protein
MTRSSRRERRTKAIAQVWAMIDDAHPRSISRVPPLRRRNALRKRHWILRRAGPLCRARGANEPSASLNHPRRLALGHSGPLPAGLGSSPSKWRLPLVWFQIARSGAFCTALSPLRPRLPAEANFPDALRIVIRLSVPPAIVSKDEMESRIAPDCPRRAHRRWRPPQASRRAVPLCSRHFPTSPGWFAARRQVHLARKRTKTEAWLGVTGAR